MGRAGKGECMGEWEGKVRMQGELWGVSEEFRGSVGQGQVVRDAMVRQFVSWGMVRG